MNVGARLYSPPTRICELAGGAAELPGCLSRDDYLYVNPHPTTPPTRHIREQNLEPLLGPFDGHAPVRLADGELVDDVLLLGLHLP